MLIYSTTKTITAENDSMGIQSYNVAPICIVRDAISSFYRVDEESTGILLNNGETVQINTPFSDIVKQFNHE